MIGHRMNTPLPTRTLQGAQRQAASLRKAATSGFIALGILTAALASASAEPVVITVRDKAGQPLDNAVVSIQVRGVRERVAGETLAEMAQRDRTFVPHVLIVQTGTAVSFPNLDTVRHHVYSFSPIKPFEIKLYVGTPTQPVVFDKAGTAVLGCNIHDKMVAYIHVVDTPYFARTDAKGMASIDVPAGEHRVRAWHPLLGPGGTPQESLIRTVAGSGATASFRLSAP